MTIDYEQLRDTLARGLVNAGLASDRAAHCARIIADSTRDGVPSHGLNLFPRLIAMIRSGVVDPAARAGRGGRRTARSNVGMGAAASAR